MILGELYSEIGFITQAALANGGVEIENTGDEPLVLTFDFPQECLSQTPGAASAWGDPLDCVGSRREPLISSD